MQQDSTSILHCLPSSDEPPRQVAPWSEVAEERVENKHQPVVLDTASIVDHDDESKWTISIRVAHVNEDADFGDYEQSRLCPSCSNVCPCAVCTHHNNSNNDQSYDHGHDHPAVESAVEKKNMCCHLCHRVVYQLTGDPIAVRCNHCRKGFCHAPFTGGRSTIQFGNTTQYAA